MAKEQVMSQVDAAVPRVSVIVPVFNRSEELRRVLLALCDQRLPEEFEILICDDGSTENIAAVVAELQHCDARPIRYFRQVNRGPGVARNLGLENARGHIVAFTDSDCLPDADWLAELTAPIDNGIAGMTGGYIDFRTADHLSGRCVNFLMSSMLGAGGARDPRSIVHMKYYPRAGNTAVLREVALAVGGFPGQNHGEDIEFSDRILQEGVNIQFVPTAIVVHNEKRTIRQVWCEAFRKGAARIRLARERGVHEWVHQLPAMLVLGLSVSALFALIFPSHALWAAMPFAAYGLVLLLVGLQGGAVLRDVRAAALLPIYTALMHIGYGCGYLATRFGRAGPSARPGLAAGQEQETRRDQQLLGREIDRKVIT